ncbi:MAG TPA: hypothetical protein VHA75_13150 [Rugosimonospora sp.]|nr:hypothetical protein [Rugosimonospora sp.]
MTAQSGDLAAGSAQWPTDHPGFSALLAAVAAYAGVAVVVIGLALHGGVVQDGLIGQFWNGVLVLGGAALFVLGLPASLGFAGASCATQRELWPGVVGGFAATMMTLTAVLLLLPPYGGV